EWGTAADFATHSISLSVPERNVLFASVTTVDSGSKALELLGLSEDQHISSPSSPDKNGSSSLKDIPVVIMSSENVPSRIDR
ncbi:hypothetical protein BHM03_00053817, partial [Ensete ventricosum]